MVQAHGGRCVVDTLTDKHIADLVDRGGKLAKEIAAAERKKVELEAIKSELRALANGKDIQFAGEVFTVTVEQKATTICRVVQEIQVPRVMKLCGEAWFKLFTLHPSKGSEKNFELNARKALPKKPADTLVDLLTVEATAWVRFA